MSSGSVTSQTFGHDQRKSVVIRFRHKNFDGLDFLEEGMSPPMREVNSKDFFHAARAIKGLSCFARVTASCCNVTTSMSTKHGLKLKFSCLARSSLTFSRPISIVLACDCLMAQRYWINLHKGKADTLRMQCSWASGVIRVPLSVR